MTQTDQESGVRELFGSGGEAYDARQYGARYRTCIADRQKLVSKVFRDLAQPTGARVLDVACGPGYFLVESISLGYRAVGMDNSPSMLQTSRAKVDDRAQLVMADAFSMPFKTGTFDVVNSSGLIEYLPQPIPFIREMRRVLKPGSHALISCTNRLSPALLLAPIIAAVRGSSTTARAVRALNLPFDEMALKRRRFRFTFHTPGHFVSMLSEAGFQHVKLHYYHLQLLPHPLDRIAPAAATGFVALTDRALSVPGMRVFAEGLLADAW